MKARVRQLDRIAGEMNAWLLALVVGLAILDTTVVVALNLPPPAQIDTAESGR